MTTMSGTSAPLLQVQGVSKRFGGFIALDGIDLDVAQGERLGLIGPNGSGKSTLVNCICGTLQQIATVTFGSEINLLFVGGLLVGFVIIAPRGIVGLVQDWGRPKKHPVKQLKASTKAPAAAKEAS